VVPEGDHLLVLPRHLPLLPLGVLPYASLDVLNPGVIVRVSDRLIMTPLTLCRPTLSLTIFKLTETQTTPSVSLTLSVRCDLVLAASRWS